MPDVARICRKIGVRPTPEIGLNRYAAKNKKNLHETRFRVPECCTNFAIPGCSVGIPEGCSGVHGTDWTTWTGWTPWTSWTVERRWLGGSGYGRDTVARRIHPRLRTPSPARPVADRENCKPQQSAPARHWPRSRHRWLPSQLVHAVHRVRSVHHIHHVPDALRDILCPRPRRLHHLIACPAPLLGLKASANSRRDVATQRQDWGTTGSARRSSTQIHMAPQPTTDYRQLTTFALQTGSICANRRNRWMSSSWSLVTGQSV